MLGWLLGGLWLWVLQAWLRLHPGLHADALYLSDLLQCLDGGRGLGHWDLPPAPSLLPDLPLLWACQAWADNLVQALRLYGLAMGLGAWWLLARLLTQLFKLPAPLARAHSAAGLLLGLLLLPVGTGLADWLLPAHHGAALLFSLWLWTWGLRQKEAPASLGRSLGLGLLLGLALQSDRVLWAWGCLPLALLALRLRRPGQARVLGLLLLAALGAWLAARALAATGARTAQVQWRFVLGRGAADWLAVLGQLPGLLRAHAALAAAALPALLLWAWPQRERDGGPRVLWLGWLLAALASLLLASLLGSYNGRDLYLLLWLPALLLPALLAERWEAWEAPSLLLPALGGLLWLLAAPAASSALPAPLEVQRAQALDALLAPRGLRYGWADYWQARPLRLFSQQGTVCVPVITGGGRVDPYLWMGDRGLLLQGDALARPQFVVSNGLDEGALRARLGRPSQTVLAQDLTVWILVAPKKDGGTR